MDLSELIEKTRQEIKDLAEKRASAQSALMDLRAKPDLTEREVSEAAAARDNADEKLSNAQGRLEKYESELARENEVSDLLSRVEPSGITPPRPENRSARVGDEPRTYREDNDPRGLSFLRDAASSFMGDYLARDRIARHMREEEFHRSEMRVSPYFPQSTRAVSTANFSGLVVPQYLTDLFAPMAANGRNFANVCNIHNLPPTGMTVEIGRGTTATSVADQSSQGDAVSESNYDDTLLSIGIRTAAGQQTISRQGVDRGVQVEETIWQDLFNRYNANLDSNLINATTTGLTNVATAVTYTDASPTTPECYGKVIEAMSGVEGALLDQGSGEVVVVMHSRRWYWMQNALSSTYPLITQPGIVAQTLGANFATPYGAAVRGVLPNGAPVIVDNNIATNLGGGTEDEIYVGDRREFHLWEDASAPMWIRCEETKASNLQVLLVLYGYYAFTHTRYAHARKVSGTGLAAPTFTGV